MGLGKNSTGIHRLSNVSLKKVHTRSGFLGLDAKITFRIPMTEQKTFAEAQGRCLRAYRVLSCPIIALLHSLVGLILRSQFISCVSIGMLIE